MNLQIKKKYLQLKKRMHLTIMIININIILVLKASLTIMEQMKKTASEKNVALSDDMLDQIAGGYYTNWGDLDQRTQMRLQQESMTAMALGEYCEIFNPEAGPEYHG